MRIPSRLLLLSVGALASITACQRQTVQSTVQITGTVTGLHGTLFLTTGHDATAVRADGAFAFHKLFASGAPYEVSVLVQPRRQTCTVSGAQGTAGQSPEAIAVTCGPAAVRNVFEDGMPASFQAGRDVLNLPELSGAGQALSNPWGRVGIADGRLYVPNVDRCKISVFDPIPPQDTQFPSWDIGGTADPNDECTRAPGPNTFSDIQDISTNFGKMAAADYMWARVLIWNTPPSRADAPADLVIGQTDFSGTSAGCGSSSLGYPAGVFITPGGKLLVVDSASARVLIWSTFPTHSGAPADLVMLQPDLDTCGRGAISNTSAFYPVGIWSDDTRIVVTDILKGRVLIWNTFPTANNAPADLVLGSPNFTDFDNSGANIHASSLYYPSAATSDGTRLFIADGKNSRVLIWNTWPTRNGQPADGVLGQPAFVSGLGGSGVSSLLYPTGLTLHGQDLVVTDRQNHRVVFYKPL